MPSTRSFEKDFEPMVRLGLQLQPAGQFLHMPGHLFPHREPVSRPAGYFPRFGERVLQFLGRRPYFA